MRVATVPVGYADGYPRLASSKTRALVAGKPAKVVGRVCMDQLMLDVTGIPQAREGMTVTMFGRDGEAFLPIEELSDAVGTIPYETVCLIGKRVPRVYVRNGRSSAWPITSKRVTDGGFVRLSKRNHRFCAKKRKSRLASRGKREYNKE